MEQFSPQALLEYLGNSGIFMRGLPLKDEFQDPSIAHILSVVLRNGSMVHSHAKPEEATALERCYREGWLHADELPGSEQIIYVLPSQFHRWFVEWKLFDNIPTILIKSNTLLGLAIKVIRGFSPTLLSTEQRIGSACIQRPPEAKFQDGFYRSCHTYLNGQLKTFPEYGTAKVWVDFYIPSKGWGVVLVCDDDRLHEHSGRVSRSGLYPLVTDYIILDFCESRPERRHPEISKLYHVVFGNNYQDVLTLDCDLQPVPGGELRLLQSM